MQNQRSEFKTVPGSSLMFRFPILALLLVFGISCGFFQHTTNRETLAAEPPFRIQITKDTLYNSNQLICLLTLDKKILNRITIDIGYSEPELTKTSQLAANKHALAAINGSFFDMKKGGAVTYFEISDSVITATRDSELIWTNPDSLLNGALILTKDDDIEITPAKPAHFYQNSNQESFVLVSGPLLIKNSVAQKLPNMGFTYKRHPRTCMGITKETIVFITIDGRSEQAAGMSLPELQQYLVKLGCIDAINLDGGGSTTMWIHDRGVINFPSDKTGERPVSNAVLILKKNSE